VLFDISLTTILIISTDNRFRGPVSLFQGHVGHTHSTRSSILVLKDGHIHEQGNFKELMELDGLFASMWADQVSGTDDQPPSVSGASIRKKASGYSVGVPGSVEEANKNTQEVSEPVEELLPTQTFSEPDSSGNMADVQHSDLVTSQLTFSGPGSAQEEQFEFPAPIDVPDHHEVTQTTEVPIQSPTLISAPIAFPSSEVNPPVIPKDESVTIPAPTLAVTFGASVNSPPSRTGTPDPESEPKRKRISSQNFQRLARRISLTTRRQSSSSSIIPGLNFKRDQSPRVSIDDNTSRAEGSSTNDSPAGSLRGDDKGKSKKNKNKNKKGST
jgi:ATP-binding cassette subfamily B (MDR/TAP) protein 6